MNLEECIRIVEYKYEYAIVYKNLTSITDSDIHRYQSHVSDVVVFCSHNGARVDLPNKTYHNTDIIYYFNINPRVLDELTLYLMRSDASESGI